MIKISFKMNLLYMLYTIKINPKVWSGEYSDKFIELGLIYIYTILYSGSDYQFRFDNIISGLYGRGNVINVQ